MSDLLNNPRPPYPVWVEVLIYDMPRGFFVGIVYAGVVLLLMMAVSQ